MMLSKGSGAAHLDAGCLQLVDLLMEQHLVELEEVTGAVQGALTKLVLQSGTEPMPLQEVLAGLAEAVPDEAALRALVAQAQQYGNPSRDVEAALACNLKVKAHTFALHVKHRAVIAKPGSYNLTAALSSAASAKMTTTRRDGPLI